MDRVFLDSEDDQERYETGREVSDPLRDNKADRVGFIDERGEGLRFGTGDHERVSQNQSDDDQLCKIAHDKGREYISRKHIQETIKVLNKMQANHVSCLSYMPEPNSPMYQDVKDGKFQLISARECLEETRQLVEGLNYGPFHFTSNHASNYLPLKGTLPDDRKKFLTMIDSALGGKSRIRSEFSRSL